MKLIEAFIFFSFLLLSQKSIAQQKILINVKMEFRSDKMNEIAYKKGQKLILDDFQGVEDPNMDAVAMAYSGVSLKYTGSIKKGVTSLDIKIVASFDKSRSWCLPTARNERTLTHEQRHFDLTALNACAFFQELKVFSFTNNFEQEIAELQKKYQRKNELDQDVYDAETNHGINREVQEEWNQKIIKAISETADCYY